MIPGLYSAASALNGLAQNHDIVAQNLAHATTPGYRRRGLAFETAQGAANNQAAGRLGTQVSKLYSDFSSGSMQYTGNPLDVAVHGDSFFVLAGPNGPLYTRNGTFELNAKGVLQSKSGFAVQGISGPITIPPNAGNIT